MCHACQSQHWLLKRVALVYLVCILVCFNNDKVKFKSTAAPGRSPCWKLLWQLGTSEGAAPGVCSCRCSSLASLAQSSQGESVPWPFPFTLPISFGNTMSCQNFLLCYHRIPSFCSKKYYLSKTANCINCQNNCLAWFLRWRQRDVKVWWTDESQPQSHLTKQKK